MDRDTFMRKIREGLGRPRKLAGAGEVRLTKSKTFSVVDPNAVGPSVDQKVRPLTIQFLQIAETNSPEMSTLIVHWGDTWEEVASIKTNSPDLTKSYDQLINRLSIASGLVENKNYEEAKTATEDFLVTVKLLVDKYVVRAAKKEQGIFIEAVYHVKAEKVAEPEAGLRAVKRVAVMHHNAALFQKIGKELTNPTKFPSRQEIALKAIKEREAMSLQANHDFEDVIEGFGKVSYKAQTGRLVVAVNDSFISYLLRNHKEASVPNKMPDVCSTVGRQELNSDSYLFEYWGRTRTASDTDTFRLTKNAQVVGTFSGSYQDMLAMVRQLSCTPEKLGYVRDRIKGYVKTPSRKTAFDTEEVQAELDQFITEQKSKGKSVKQIANTIYDMVRSDVAMSKYVEGYIGNAFDLENYIENFEPTKIPSKEASAVEEIVYKDVLITKEDDKFYVPKVVRSFNTLEDAKTEVDRLLDSGAISGLGDSAKTSADTKVDFTTTPDPSSEASGIMTASAELEIGDEVRLPGASYMKGVVAHQKKDGYYILWQETPVGDEDGPYQADELVKINKSIKASSKKASGPASVGDKIEFDKASVEGRDLADAEIYEGLVTNVFNEGPKNRYVVEFVERSGTKAQIVIREKDITKFDEKRYRTQSAKKAGVVVQNVFLDTVEDAIKWNKEQSKGKKGPEDKKEDESDGKLPDKLPVPKGKEDGKSTDKEKLDLTKKDDKPSDIGVVKNPDGKPAKETSNSTSEVKKESDETAPGDIVDRTDTGPGYENRHPGYSKGKVVEVFKDRSMALVRWDNGQETYISLKSLTKAAEHKCISKVIRNTLQKVAVTTQDGDAWVQKTMDKWEWEYDDKIAVILQSPTLNYDQKVEAIKERVAELINNVVDEDEIAVKNVVWSDPKVDVSDIVDLMEEYEELKSESSLKLIEFTKKSSVYSHFKSGDKVVVTGRVEEVDTTTGKTSVYAEGTTGVVVSESDIDPEVRSYNVKLEDGTVITVPIYKLKSATEKQAAETHKYRLEIEYDEDAGWGSAYAADFDVEAASLRDVLVQKSEDLVDVLERSGVQLDSPESTSDEAITKLFEAELNEGDSNIHIKVYRDGNVICSYIAEDEEEADKQAADLKVIDEQYVAENKDSYTLSPKQLEECIKAKENLKYIYQNYKLADELIEKAISTGEELEALYIGQLLNEKLVEKALSKGESLDALYRQQDLSEEQVGKAIKKGEFLDVIKRYQYKFISIDQLADLNKAFTEAAMKPSDKPQAAKKAYKKISSMEDLQEFVDNLVIGEDLLLSDPKTVEELEQGIEDFISDILDTGVLIDDGICTENQEDKYVSKLRGMLKNLTQDLRKELESKQASSSTDVQVGDQVESLIDRSEGEIVKGNNYKVLQVGHGPTGTPVILTDGSKNWFPYIPGHWKKAHCGHCESAQLNTYEVEGKFGTEKSDMFQKVEEQVRNILYDLGGHVQFWLSDFGDIGDLPMVGVVIKTEKSLEEVQKAFSAVPGIANIKKNAEAAEAGFKPTTFKVDLKGQDLPIEEMLEKYKMHIVDPKTAGDQETLQFIQLLKDWREKGFTSIQSADGTEIHPVKGTAEPVKEAAVPTYKATKQYLLIAGPGCYRPNADLGRLRGNGTFTEVVEGLNGDGSDEWKASVPIDEAVSKLVELGVVKQDGDRLIDLENQSAWEAFSKWLEPFMLNPEALNECTIFNCKTDKTAE